jgi:glycosyltransferase involved in cell wall biosynthesis
MRRVLHVIETIAPREGGPPRVVAGLAVAQRAMGIDAHILCGDGRLLAEHLQYWQVHAPGFPSENVHSIATHRNNLAARGAALRGWLRAQLPNFDVVHIHQLWRLVPTLTANACRRLRTPYLIAPHTSLSQWALGQSRAKKTIARWLVWNRIFSGAAGFHALNDLEALEIKECIGTNGPPVFVVPNGVSLVEFPGTPIARAPAHLAGLLSPTDGSKPFILFLARLHTMKGPDLLLDAFAHMARELPELQLAFAGPDFGMLDVLKRRVADLQLVERVHFLGLVSGSDRLWLLENSVCLCQPSRDEGFSLSILEAMACRCPVVISDRCKFPDVARHSAGVIVPNSTSGLASALHLYASDLARRASDGRSARLLVERFYTWDIVSKQADQMYAQAICGRSDAAAPNCGLAGSRAARDPLGRPGE